MFGIGPGEIALIAVLAVLLLGDKQLPEVMKKCIRWTSKAKKTMRDLQNSLYQTRDEIEKSVQISTPLNQEPIELEDTDKNLTTYNTPASLLKDTNEPKS